MTGPESAEPPEFLPPRLSLTWKIGLAAIPISAALLVTGTFRELYARALKGIGSPNAPPSYRTTYTLWKEVRVDGLPMSAPPGYAVPVTAAATLLVVSSAVLLFAARKPVARVAGRTLAFSAVSFLTGVAWTLFVSVKSVERQLNADPDGLAIFTYGDALWFVLAALVLAAAGSALTLTRALDPPRPAGPMVYRIPSDNPSDNPSDDSSAI